MARKKHLKLDPWPIGALSGASEFTDFFPEETMGLGALTAFWLLVEHYLCHVLASLLSSMPKAEAAFYSTLNHKARRDMVLAVARNAELPSETLALVEAAITATKSAADTRNALLHGLFKVEHETNELIVEHRRPFAKVPKFKSKHIIKDINACIEKCETAMELLSYTSSKIIWPDWPDDFERELKKAAAERKTSQSS